MNTNNNNTQTTTSNGPPTLRLRPNTEWQKTRPKKKTKPKSTNMHTDKMAQAFKKLKAQTDIIKGKKFWFTFANCNCSPLEMENNIKKLFGENLDTWAIWIEDHADGTPHLHAVVTTKNPIKPIQGEALGALDYMVQTPERPQGQRGEYRTTNNLARTLSYCPGEPARQHGIDAQQYVAKQAKRASWGTKKNNMSTLQNDIKNGRFTEYKQVYDNNEFDHLTSMHPQKIKAMFADKQVMTQKALIPWKPLVIDKNEGTTVCRLKISLNIIMMNKEGCLYLWGLSGSGKSHILTKFLRQFFRLCDVTECEEFDDHMMSQNYFGYCMSEFEGRRSLSFMKKLIAGEQQYLKQKCVAAALSRPDCPVFIDSQRSFIDNYIKRGENLKFDDIEAIQRRITEINITEYIPEYCFPTLIDTDHPEKGYSKRKQKDLDWIASRQQEILSLEHPQSGLELYNDRATIKAYPEILELLEEYRPKKEIFSSEVVSLEEDPEQPKKAVYSAIDLDETEEDSDSMDIPDETLAIQQEGDKPDPVSEEVKAMIIADDIIRKYNDEEEKRELRELGANGESEDSREGGSRDYFESDDESSDGSGETEDIMPKDQRTLTRKFQDAYDHNEMEIYATNKRKRIN